MKEKGSSISWQRSLPNFEFSAKESADDILARLGQFKNLMMATQKRNMKA